MKYIVSVLLLVVLFGCAKIEPGSRLPQEAIIIERIYKGATYEWTVFELRGQLFLIVTYWDDGIRSITRLAEWPMRGVK